MKHPSLQDQYLTYIQISRPIGPQQTTQTTKKGTPPPPLFNQQEHENLISENQFGHSIFDDATSDDGEDNGNWIFNNLSLNTSKDDDNISIDLEIENQLNKHFGFSTSTTTFSSTSAVKSVTSTAASHITKTPTATTDSKHCTYTKNTTAQSTTCEVIPLDPNICFDHDGYRCPSFGVAENKPRWRVFKEGCFFHVWADTKTCYINQIIDTDMADEFTVEQLKATCSYEPDWAQETHRYPISVDKYVDYLYFLADAHSVYLMQMNYKKFLFANRLFKLKQV